MINPGFCFKILFWGAVLSWAGWTYVLKRPFYQYVFGTETEKELRLSETDTFVDIPKQKKMFLEVNGYEIKVQATKFFKTVAYIVYVDRYTPLGTWYRSRKESRLYDKIVPQDVSWATGKIGRSPECFKFTHEYRLLETLYTGYHLDVCPQNIAKNIDIEVSNNHVIAASINVQKGLDILKAGDVAAIEGYAVDWSGTGDLRDLHFESATVLGQISDQLPGGQRAHLCRQLLITKITFDGRTFE